MPSSPAKDPEPRMRDATPTSGAQLATIRTLAASSPAAIAVLRGPELRLAYVNAAFITFAGRPAAMQHGLPLAEALPELGPEGLLARLALVRKRGGAWHCSAAQLPCGPPGIWSDIEATPLGPPQGDLLLQLRAFRDAPAQALLGQLTLASWAAAPDGRLTAAESWVALTGQPPREAEGWGWLATLHPEDRAAAAAAWHAALAEGAPYSAEYRLARPEGGWRWTAARAVALRDPGGAPGLGRRHHRPRARRQAEAALRASEAASTPWPRASPTCSGRPTRRAAGIRQ